MASGSPFVRNQRRCDCDRPEDESQRRAGDEACGWCRICGSAGHRRRFPGILPFRAGWCDRHYRMVCRWHPLGRVGFLRWTLLTWSLVVPLVWYLQYG